jgi:uroporphyrinogen decarboxylase
MWPEVADRVASATGTIGMDGLLAGLGSGCAWIHARYCGPTLPPDATGRIASPHSRYSLNASIWGLAGGTRELGLETAGHPLANVESPADLARHAWPSPDWFDYAGLVDDAARHPDAFVVVGGFSPLFYLMADLCGMERILLDLLDRPALCAAIVDRILEFYEAYFERIAASGARIDAIAFGDDFSSQRAMLMSPGVWRRTFGSAWARLFAVAHRHGLSVAFHSCGAMAPVIPDLIDKGLDVLYPVQPLAAGMDLGELQRKYRASLAFYGGLDVQDLLPHGTPAQIGTEVRRLAGLFGDGGGYVLSTSHVIMDDVPTENVIALYRAAEAL